MLHIITPLHLPPLCLPVLSPTVFHPESISVNINGGGCVSMATGFATGLWELRECATAKAKFICRQNQDTSLSPEPPAPQPTPSINGFCPGGWKSNSNLRYCYKVPSALFTISHHRQSHFGFHLFVQAFVYKCIKI